MTSVVGRQYLQVGVSPSFFFFLPSSEEDCLIVNTEKEFKKKKKKKKGLCSRLALGEEV